MSSPSDFTLSQAARVYGVANTPLFLVRKLQADQEVRAMSDALSGEQILNALREAVKGVPATPVEDVRPYAFLVALWFKPEVEHLREAAKLSAPSWRWFDYIAAVLLQTFSPVFNQVVRVPPAVSMNSPSVESTAPINRTIIIP